MNAVERQLKLLSAFWMTARLSTPLTNLPAEHTLRLVKQNMDLIKRVPAQHSLSTLLVNYALNPDSVPQAIQDVAAAAAQTAIPDGYTASQAEKKAQAALLQHIIGKSFRPYPTPASWPSTVLELAHALYNGGDCRLPLIDALEEAGHAELAEHFRTEEWHMKGCWAMDLVLGKS